MNAYKFVFTAALALISATSALSASSAELNTELHWLICENDAATTLQKLSADQNKADAKSRAVFYYDTPARELSSSGIVLRFREKSGGAGTSTAKARVANLRSVPAAWFDDDQFKCEYDRHGETENLNCSLDRKRSKNDEGAFTSEQFQMVEELTGVSVNAEQLEALGPAEELAWKKIQLLTDNGKTELALESDRVGRLAQPILEISNRVGFSEEKSQWRAVSSALDNLGLRLCEDQSSKTSKIIDAVTRR